MSMSFLREIRLWPATVKLGYEDYRQTISVYSGCIAMIVLWNRLFSLNHKEGSIVDAKAVNSIYILPTQCNRDTSPLLSAERKVLLLSIHYASDVLAVYYEWFG